MSWLSNGAGEIEIYVGEGGRLAVQSSALSYQSPMRIREAYSSPEEDCQLKEVDDDFLDEDSVDSDNDASDASDPQEGSL